MEVIGDGDHEQSFLVPRFERAKRGREGDFPLLHSILIMPFCFYSHAIRYTSTHPKSRRLYPQTPPSVPIISPGP